MALDAAIVFEFRTTGSNDNGGGFKTGASGTDYSQQDAAQLSSTDGEVKNSVYTKLYSASKDHNVAAYVGNVVYIKSGTNFTVGWYEITGVGSDGDGDYLTLDRNCASANSNNAVYAIGGARALPTDAFFEALTAGNTVYIKKGTYTLTENLSISKAGTAIAPISIIGYNSSRTDNPTQNNRPIFICAAYYFYLNNYYKTENCIFNGTASSGVFLPNNFNTIANCLIINKSGSANYPALRCYGSIHASDCDLCSTNGLAIYSSNYDTYFNCYIHDSNEGIDIISGYCRIINCIIENIVTNGIETNSGYVITIINNTIYNCGTGINGNASYHLFSLNNIIDTCTTGASWTTEEKINYWDYNNWHGNSTDVSNVTKGANATAVDPEFEFVGVRGTDDSGVNNKTTYTVDTSENFTTLGVTVGDTILNKTDGSWGTITSISTTTNPNDTVNFSGGLTGGTDNDFDNGDTYSILGNFALKSTSDCIGAGFGIRLGVGA